MERQIPLSQIEITQQQRMTAATMKNVARETCTTAAAMYDSAERMRKTARAAVVRARRQLAPLQESSDVG